MDVIGRGARFGPLLAGVALLSLAACPGGKKDASVDGIEVAQANGTILAEEAPNVALTAVQRPADIAFPDGDKVRLVIARDVTYGAAKQLIKRAEAEGKAPIILVGDRTKLRAIALNDELEKPRKAIRLVATPDGKVCVAHPDSPESKCAEQVYSNHVSKASVREFVREAINAYGLMEVAVYARPSVQWADVIRAVDGARTCCDGKMTPRVRLVDFDGADLTEADEPTQPAMAAEPSPDEVADDSDDGDEPADGP